MKLSNDQKLAALKNILDNTLEAPEKRLVLSGLSPIPDSQALALAAAMLDDPAVRAESAQSVILIAQSLAATRPDEAGAALTRVLSVIAGFGAGGAEKNLENVRLRDAVAGGRPV